MITENDFLLANGVNVWKLVDESHPLKLYVGKDEKGRFSFEYVGLFTYNKNVKSSKLIEINQCKTFSKHKSIIFSLTDNSALKEFCIFCNDIVESTYKLSKYTKKGYEEICNLYFTWQKMFKSQNELMSVSEIKGLIGELLFLRDNMFPKYGISIALSSWAGPEASKKDFSVNNKWYEIKAIDFGKSTVEISSLEQLDSPFDGELVVYQLEKMAIEYGGITLNKLINEIIKKITSLSDKDIFLEKLKNMGFFFSELYDNFVYDVKNKISYRVDNRFPKIIRRQMHKAIAKVAYEITLSEIISYKI